MGMQGKFSVIKLAAGGLNLYQRNTKVSGECNMANNSFEKILNSKLK
jgi:hypothetical protein